MKIKKLLTIVSTSIIIFSSSYASAGGYCSAQEFYDAGGYLQTSYVCQSGKSAGQSFSFLWMCELLCN